MYYFFFHSEFTNNTLVGKSDVYNISPEEILFKLSKMEILREPDKNEYFASMSKKAEKIINLFPEQLHMG